MNINKEPVELLLRAAQEIGALQALEGLSAGPLVHDNTLLPCRALPTFPVFVVVVVLLFLGPPPVSPRTKLTWTTPYNPSLGPAGMKHGDPHGSHEINNAKQSAQLASLPSLPAPPPPRRRPAHFK